MDYPNISALTPEQHEALLNGPALAPPPGQIPNFNHPDTLSIYVVPTIVLCITFSTLALLMRIYTQRAIARPLYREDYVAIVAWGMFIGFCVPNIICARHGGAHQWNTRLEEFFLMLYYLRIFVPTRQSNMKMFMGICVVFWAHLTFYIVDTFFQIFSCNPREMAWNKLITDGHCFNLPATFVASGSVNVVSDFVLLILPIYSIWKLQITTKQKLQISGAFATGLLVCVASIGRLVYIVILFRTTDMTRAIIPPGLCGLAEISLGLICSCLPTFPMFYQVLRSQLPSITIFGFHPFPASSSDPLTLNGTVPSRQHTRGSKHQSVWDGNANGGRLTAKEYHELADWQLTPRHGELMVTISSPGRSKDGDTRSQFSGLESGLNGSGAMTIVQTVEVEIEERNLGEKSYYDSS
ncbi:hypothetical protein G7Y89_g14487 [Cudoniella acicularis]|uniref:Rhodopsin domain-containing protein n=1 Tax=Cudoniella acicularis TaxID=354080 RepID=A0A8H4VT15_9HELO|nr:hypothetical protein G7Y89_g14487 [Cudoniella acicularis]